MINLDYIRNRYVVYPIVPSGTEQISYNVYINNTLMFIGNTKYFGDYYPYEVDLSDFIETAIYAGLTNITCRIVFSFDGTSTTYYEINWTPDIIDLPLIDTNTEPAYMSLSKCGFKIKNNSVASVLIPLKVYNGYLVGKTTNNLDKTTYIDRYGNSHNGGVTNHIEVECYIDPDWLSVTTNSDIAYEQVMLALQCAANAHIQLHNNKIKGFTDYSGLYNYFWGKVVDIEKVELYSSYNKTNKVPSMKITFEVYNSLG